MFRVGATYRNKFMKDIDMWVSAINGQEITCWWVLRRNGRILNSSADKVKGLRNEDWERVD